MSASVLVVVAALYAGLSVAIWRAAPASRVHRLFALQTVTVAGWTLGNAGLQTATFLVASMHLTFASASLIPPAFLVFAVHYPILRTAPSPIWLRLAVYLGFGFCLSSLLTSWIFRDVQLTAEGLFRQPGPLYPFFAIYFLLVFFVAFAIFANKWRHARHREQIQLNYFGIGVLIAAIGGISTNLIVPWLSGRSSLSYLGPYFGIPFIALTAHSIARHRFLGLRVLAHRGLTFIFACLLSLLPVAALVIVVWPRLVSTFSVTELLLGLAAMLAIAILIPPMRDGAERIVDGYFYRSRINPQRLVRETSIALGRCVDGRGVTQILTSACEALVTPEGHAVYLASGDALVLAHSFADSGGSNAFSAPTNFPESVFGAVAHQSEALVLEETSGALRTTLERLQWRVVLPLRVDQELLGVVALGGRRSGDIFFADHIDTLVALAHGAASALKTIALLQYHSRIERLEGLQRVADGLAHEFGNLLAPIKTLVRLLPERHRDGRFVDDFARIAGRELNRMERLLARLKRLAPAAPADYDLLDLRDPLRHAIEVIRAHIAEHAIIVFEDICDESLPVHGDVAELEEVFLNLLTNAYEAVVPTRLGAGRIALRARRTLNEAVVSVEDAGPGVDSAVIGKIFDPFVSTKARGSGLGLSICAGIVARHNGRIEAHNVPGAGAAFTIHLPLAAGTDATVHP
ncbi:MAG: GAF domain-containing protein [Candidatus Rokubacteria bacterium]|nr:GAF domain-containing protein [Candidatus Rokubacteria bacterium]